MKPRELHELWALRWLRWFCRSEIPCDISMISEIIYVVLLVESVAARSIVTSVPFEGKTFTELVFLDGKIFAYLYLFL